MASTAAEVAEVEWSKLAGDLYRCSEKIDELWDRARDERNATDAAHKAALAAVRAEKAAPGSKDDLKKAEGLWALLRSLTEVVGRECAVAGYQSGSIALRSTTILASNYMPRVAS